MTKVEAESLVKKHGSLCAAERATGVSRRTITRALNGKCNRSMVPSASKSEPVEQPHHIKGFAVGPETRVAAKRPANTIRSRFYELKRGMAFPDTDVSREWCISVETLRRHAQDAECFRYIEVGNEKWIGCVMHPDTAKGYPVK